MGFTTNTQLKFLCATNSNYINIFAFNHGDISLPGNITYAYSGMFPFYNCINPIKKFICNDKGMYMQMQIDSSINAV